MTSRYRVAVNLEWTGKCNARCIMCPREAITQPRIMDLATLEQAVKRLSPRDVFRVVIAGYGEPTTHPRFDACVDSIRHTAVRTDMVSNGQLLDASRLRRLDGALHTLIISFSSVERAVYERIQINLDHARVMENIVLARAILRTTRLAISLTPLAACIDSLPQTIAWLRGNGVSALSMSPSLYDRAGVLARRETDALALRRVIRRYGLRSQELDFVPSAAEVFAQWRANRFKCIPRNSDLVIAADGSYQYCFNDIGHGYPLGHVTTMSVREALSIRERSPPAPALCDECGLRRRYGPVELLQAAWGYACQRRGEAR